MIRLTDEERETMRAYQLGRAAERTVARLEYGTGAPRWRTSFAVFPRPCEEGSLDLVLAAARHPGEETGVARWTVGAPVWYIEHRLDYHYGPMAWSCNWDRPPDRHAGGIELDVRRERGETAPTWPWAPLLYHTACEGSPWEWVVRAVADASKVNPKFAPTVLAAWPRHPGVELLARAGLPEGWYKPSALALLERSPRLRSWVAQNADELARLAASPSVALPIAGRGGTIEDVRREDYYRTLWHGLTLHGVDRADAAVWCEQHGVTRADYSDYLDLAVAAGLDPRSRSVAFPRRALAVYAMLERAGQIRADAAKTERAKAAAKMAAAARRAAERIARMPLPEGWSVIIPRTQDELAREGARMRNCIGSGTYSADMAAGRCVCVVVVGPDDIRADVQVASGRVQQCYGPCNAPAHPIAQDIARRVAATLGRVAA